MMHTENNWRPCNSKIHKETDSKKRRATQPVLSNRAQSQNRSKRRDNRGHLQQSQVKQLTAEKYRRVEFQVAR